MDITPEKGPEAPLEERVNEAAAALIREDGITHDEFFAKLKKAVPDFAADTDGASFNNFPQRVLEKAGYARGMLLGAQGVDFTLIDDRAEYRQKVKEIVDEAPAEDPMAISAVKEQTMERLIQLMVITSGDDDFRDMFDLPHGELRKRYFAKDVTAVKFVFAAAKYLMTTGGKQFLELW